jgi:hypothetical protein
MLESFLNKVVKWVMDKGFPMYLSVKEFVKSKGFTALVSLGVGSIFLLMGYPFIGGIGFGIFFSKNTQIIKELLEEYEII